MYENGIIHHIYIQNKQDERKECIYCKTICHLSCVICKCEKSMNNRTLSCLRHIQHVCDCPNNNQKYLLYWYTIDELINIQNKINDYRTSIIDVGHETTTLTVNGSDIDTLYTATSDDDEPSTKTKEIIVSSNKVSSVTIPITNTKKRTRLSTSRKNEATVPDIFDDNNNNDHNQNIKTNISKISPPINKKLKDKEEEVIIIIDDD